MKPTKMPIWGKPGPPNSGSSPMVPGNRMAVSPVSQYTEPAKARIKVNSRRSCGVKGFAGPCQVYQRVRQPRRKESWIVWALWNLVVGV